MSPEKPEQHLLASYVLGGLNEEERQKLFEAALKDQDLFDRLVEEESLRLALEEPKNRKLVLAAARPSWRELLADYLRQPQYLAVAAAAAAIAIAFAVWMRPSGDSLTVALDPTSGPAISMLGVESPQTEPARPAEWSQLYRLPVQQRLAARLALNKSGATPEYRIGESLRVGLSVDHGGNCLLLDRQENQLPTRLFPNRFVSGMSVPAGQTVFVPPAGQGNIDVAGPPGLHQLRLIVAPADVTLDLAAPASWSDKATVIQREYRVLPAAER
jgi:hypothetical protein